MSLLNKLLSNARKADIGFGIHDNCVILEVSNEGRKNKDNQPIKRNSYTKFGQLDTDGNVVAEREISWFNLDHANEYVYDNFFTQLDQMTSIVDVFVDSSKKDLWALGFASILEEEEVDETEEDLKEALTDKETCANILTALSDLYVEILTDHVGPESKKVRFKIVYEKSGKYLQQPRYGIFVEDQEVAKEDSRLKMSKVEEEYKIKSQNVGSATNKQGSLKI